MKRSEFEVDNLGEDNVRVFLFCVCYCFLLCCFCGFGFVWFGLVCLLLFGFLFVFLLHDLSHSHFLHTKDVKFFSERALDLHLRLMSLCALLLPVS